MRILTVGLVDEAVDRCAVEQLQLREVDIAVAVERAMSAQRPGLP
jgi:hypothetical protein